MIISTCITFLAPGYYYILYEYPIQYTKKYYICSGAQADEHTPHCGLLTTDYWPWKYLFAKGKVFSSFHPRTRTNGNNKSDTAIPVD